MCKTRCPYSDSRRVTLAPYNYHVFIIIIIIIIIIIVIVIRVTSAHASKCRQIRIVFAHKVVPKGGAINIVIELYLVCS